MLPWVEKPSLSGDGVRHYSMDVEAYLTEVFEPGGVLDDLKRLYL